MIQAFAFGAIFHVLVESLDLLPEYRRNMGGRIKSGLQATHEIGHGEKRGANL
jgi:hypothetical protein